MATHDDEDDVVERMTMVAHNGLLARYAEHKLGLSIVTPEEPDDPEAQPGPCAVRGAGHRVGRGLPDAGARG